MSDKPIALPLLCLLEPMTRATRFEIDCKVSPRDDAKAQAELAEAIAQLAAIAKLPAKR
jgi:hypothetical protein